MNQPGLINLATHIKQLSSLTTVVQKKRACDVVGAGAVIMDVNMNKLLVVRGPEKWSLPKGHLEPGEEPHEGAMREIFEETSLQIEITSTYKSKKVRKYIYYYLILQNATQLELTPLDGNEVSEVKWCTREELIAMDCNKQLKYFVDKWKLMIRHGAVSVIGTVPNPTEMITLKNEFALKNNIYKELYGVSRKKNEDDSDSDHTKQ